MEEARYGLKERYLEKFTDLILGWSKKKFLDGTSFAQIITLITGGGKY